MFGSCPYQPPHGLNITQILHWINCLPTHGPETRCKVLITSWTQYLNYSTELIVYQQLMYLRRDAKCSAPHGLNITQILHWLKCLVAYHLMDSISLKYSTEVSVWRACGPEKRYKRLATNNDLVNFVRATKWSVV
jgi:hypothetical protein